MPRFKLGKYLTKHGKGLTSHEKSYLYTYALHSVLLVDSVGVGASVPGMCHPGVQISLNWN